MSDELARRDEAVEISPGGFIEAVYEDPPDEAPEFVIVGIRRAGGGVTLFVSNQVTDARFARQVKGYDQVKVPGASRPAMLPRVHAIVGVEMTSFEQILADDFRSALSSLVGRMLPGRAIASGYDQPQS